jgi:pre-mRNA-splicing factor SYF1
MYEKHNRLDSAEDIFERDTQLNYKAVDNFYKAIELMRQVTLEPSLEFKRRGII